MTPPTSTASAPKVDSDEFARVLTKQAAAHVCVALGFTATTAGALECLTDVVQRYLEDMAKRTMENTYRAGRTEANVADVLQGFQQMPIPLNWRELRDFAFSEEGYSTGIDTAKRKKASTSRSSSHGLDGGVGVSSGGSGSGASGEDGGDAKEQGKRKGDGDGEGEDEEEGEEEDGEEEERPKRWDQPFHHAVPAFPMPRNATPWGGVAGGQTSVMDDGEACERGGPGIRPPHIPDFTPPLPPGIGFKRSREQAARSGRSAAEIRPERLKRQRQGEAALRNLGPPVAAPPYPSIATAAAAVDVDVDDNNHRHDHDHDRKTTAVATSTPKSSSSAPSSSSTSRKIKITSSALRDGREGSGSGGSGGKGSSAGEHQRNGASPIRKLKLSTGSLGSKKSSMGSGGRSGGGSGGVHSSSSYFVPKKSNGSGSSSSGKISSSAHRGGVLKEGRGGSGGGRDSPRVGAVSGGGSSGGSSSSGKSKNGMVAGAGGSASGAGKRGGLPKMGFRAIAPAAVSAKASAAAAANVPGMAAGLKRPKGGVGGGGRGAFGRLNDSSREDRILEGLAPDGGGDMEAAV